MLGCANEPLSKESTMLEKTFNPKSFESIRYLQTEPFFKADPKSDKKPFTLMMPPPNVTGSLHLGHALTYTLQDILVRFKRQCGFDALWQPGTDHAGIATQMVVERQLAEQNITRQDLGRDAFLEKVWEWKKESGDTIVEQQRRLGISPDWERSRFTMDEGLSEAVSKVFIELYQKGLIYRAKRLVNWDSKLKTAISDLEVINQDVKGHMYYIRYPLADDSTQSILVATTRPETLFGDTAVAVHPDDERYQHLIGKMVCLPLTNREIPIIADTYCDPEKGTGALKITPGHDFNDFAVGERHGLPQINILDADACLNDQVPLEFQGLSVDQACEKVVTELAEHALLMNVEAITHAVPYGDRSGVQIQPWLTDQWFVDAKVLAEPAIKAVEEGRIRFVPEQWNNTYFEWLRNIQPWCISRQIWWGHQIPAWYSPDGHVFVADGEESAHAQAVAHYGEKVDLTRDTDVLDTWFSSALWPFSTLGWPQDDTLSKRYYPTDVLITGFDIIFFWVARMIMMGLYFKDDVPFHTVYIHALVRDEKGQKMSKSKGNIINPLELIDKYGTDALRFTLAALAAPGRDIKLGESRVEGYRNFLTKIWNAARFLQMNECTYNPDFDSNTCQHLLNRWIVYKTKTLARDVHQHLETYRFDWAAQSLYQFLWGSFCDIYIECLKPLLNETDDEALHQETRQTASWVLMEFLKIAHPFIPLVTEELWQAFYPNAPYLLIQSPWPAIDQPLADDKNLKAVEFALSIVAEVRSLRGFFNLSPTLKIPLLLDSHTDDAKVLQDHQSWILHLGRLESLDFNPNDEEKQKSVPFVIGQNTFFLKLGHLINLDAAYKVLEMKREALDKEAEHLQKKLSNTAYQKAKPESWQADKELLEAKQHEQKRLRRIVEG